MTVKEFMSSHAQEIVGEIQKNIFSSRDFIYGIAESFEREYIQLLNEDESEHPVWNVHKQIGRYLADNAEFLSIRDSGRKEESISIFGKKSFTEIWNKI